MASTNEFKRGDRVRHWGAYRVGTVIDAWNLIYVLWDYPRVTNYTNDTVEDSTMEIPSYLEIAAPEDESRNRANMFYRSQKPVAPTCGHCGHNQLRYIEERLSYDKNNGSYYREYSQCKKCKKLTWIRG